MDVSAEIKGSVVHGKKKGRKMGFPTASDGTIQASLKALAEDRRKAIALLC